MTENAISLELMVDVFIPATLFQRFHVQRERLPMRNSHLHGQLPARPKIPPYFDIIFMENHRCQIRAGNDKIFVLRGRTVSEILPQLFQYLDGTYTLSEIVDGYKDIATEEEIMTIIERLNEGGILEDASIEPPPTLTPEEIEYYAPQLLFFSHFTGDRYGYQVKLKESQVAIIGLGLIGSAALISLAISGVGHITGIDDRKVSLPSPGVPYSTSDIGKPAATALAYMLGNINPNISFKGINDGLQSQDEIPQVVKGKDVVIVAMDKPRVSIYDWINEVCLDENIPWITCSSLNSIEGIVGPFIVPHETCCYKCYELRAKSTMDAYDEYVAFEEYLKEKEGRTADYGHLPHFATIMGHFIALEVIKHLTQFVPPETYGSLFSINFMTLQTEFHEVLKLPRCPSCGPAKDAPPRALWSR